MRSLVADEPAGFYLAELVVVRAILRCLTGLRLPAQGCGGFQPG